MKRAELLTLADRYEKAEGENRELDVEVWRGLVHRAASTNRFPLPWDARFSASLDAAVSLVPEGWHWSVSADRFGYVRGKGPRGGPDPEGWSRDAATPALALTVATLRARAEEAEG